MSRLGAANIRAMSMAMSGKSGDEIRADAKKNHSFLGNNIFTESWAKHADREDPAANIKQKSSDDGMDFGW